MLDGSATVQEIREFPSRPASIAQARRFLREVLQDVRTPFDRDSCLLMLSELATNAIRHTPGPSFHVRVARTANALLVGVSDQDPSLPVVRAQRADRSGGHGLPLIERLAEQWGVTPEETGKCVWFRLRLR